MKLTFNDTICGNEISYMITFYKSSFEYGIKKDTVEIYFEINTTTTSIGIEFRNYEFTIYNDENGEIIIDYEYNLYLTKKLQDFILKLYSMKAFL